MRTYPVLALLSSLVIALNAVGQDEAIPSVRDVKGRARAIGTDKPQNAPSRVLVTDPTAHSQKFPAFVLGVEKAPRSAIGCPKDRGLALDQAPAPLQAQIRRTLEQTPMSTDCLFVSHIAEFLPTDDPASFAPKLLYNAYRDLDPPATHEVFASGERATLALADRIRAVAAARAKAGRPVTHLIVFATGWHTPQAKTLDDMDELFSSIVEGADSTAFSPLFLGISWPSFSDEVAGKVSGGLGIAVEEAQRQLRRKDLDPKSRQRLKGIVKSGWLVPFLNTSPVADKLGFLGYPAISKDADEVGMVPVGTLVNRVLLPVREALPGKPRVVVIGHSFGARIAAWSAYSALLKSEGPGPGPDLVIGLQGAFPAARFDRSAQGKWWYDEGASFADRQGLKTAFSFTCADDEALGKSREVIDLMIGDIKTFKRSEADRVPAFFTSMASGSRTALKIDPAPTPGEKRVVLIDARALIHRHDDVRNAEVGALIRRLISILAPDDRAGG